MSFAQKIKIKRIKLLALLVTIVVIGLSFVLLRYYNLPKIVIFNWDQERDALAVKQILSGDMVMIGPRVLGPGGFFLPPFFFYLLTPFYLLTNLSPYAIVYFLVFYGVVFFLTSYIVIEKIFGKATALTFLVLWAVLPLTVSIDTIAWNPLLIPLTFILLLYSLYKHNNESRFRWIILSGLIYGLGISFHVQFVFYGLLIIPFLFSVGSEKLKDYVLNLIALLGGVFLVFVPLLLFDIKNNFINLGLIINFVSNTTSKELLAFVPVWVNFTGSLLSTGANTTTGIFLYIIVLGLLVYLVRKSKKNGFLRKLFCGFVSVWVFTPILFIMYGSRPSEYYFNYLVPIVLLGVSYVVSELISTSKNNNRYVVAMIVMVLILFIRTFNNIETDPKSLYYKVETAVLLSKAISDGKKYDISYTVPLGGDSGFRYIVNYYGLTPTGNPDDPLIQITEPAHDDSTIRAGTYGVIIPEELVYTKRY